MPPRLTPLASLRSDEGLRPPARGLSPASGHPLQMEGLNLERDSTRTLPPSPNWRRSGARAPFGEGLGVRRSLLESMGAYST